MPKRLIALRDTKKNGLLVGIELCDSLMNSYADVDNGIQLTPVAASGDRKPDSITDENEPPADPVVPQVKAGMSRLIKSWIRSCIKHWTRSWQKQWPEILFTKSTNPGSNG
jgi:hypothetical protein